MSITMDVGICAEDLKKGSYSLKVYIPNKSNGYTGDLNETVGYKGKSGVGDKMDHSVSMGATVTAKWTTFDPTMIIAPMIKKGMEVFLICYPDDRYEWVSKGFQPDLMKKNAVVKILGNVDEFTTSLSADNSHMFYYDMVDAKTMGIKTVANDGEATTFDIQLDLKKGVVKIEDGNGNKFSHDGKNGTLNMEYLKSVDIKAPSINIEASTDATLKGATVKVEADSSLTLKAAMTDIDTITNFKQKMLCNNNAMIMGFVTPMAHGATIM